MSVDPLQERHQKVSRQLIQVSLPLRQIVQDQWKLLGAVSAENIFESLPEQGQLFMVNRLFCVQVNPSCTTPEDLFQVSLHLPEHLAHVSDDKIHDFIFNTVEFHAQDRKAYHALYLQTRAQIFRQKLIEQVFAWIQGEARVEAFVQQLSLEDAAEIDQILMAHDYYTAPHLTQYIQQGTHLPHKVLINLKHICLMSSVYGARFLPIHELMKHYDALCFEHVKFLSAPLYRLAQVFFPQGFTLKQFTDKWPELQALYRHAQEQPRLLAYSKWIDPSHWANTHLFAKRHFLSPAAGWWHWQQAVPDAPFDFSKTVNWLFKQEAVVVDWIAHHQQHISTRCAVTALSFVDTTQIHPQVLMMTLRYFQHTAGAMLIHSAYYLAREQAWFSQPNCRYGLKDEMPINSTGRIAITRSALYLEEWLNLIADVSQEEPKRTKQVYLRLTRVMQAYMQYLQQVVNQLDRSLYDFIHPQSHEHRGFYQALQQAKMEVSQFRECFDLVEAQTRESIFDAYVRDYLVDLFTQDVDIPKTVTWPGLFSRAITWHDQNMKDDILARLKKDGHMTEWPAVTQTWFELEQWRFEEMHSLDRIVQESKVFKHCLAVSYAQRIIEQHYVAYHFYHLEHDDARFTLGCILRDGILYFDQCEAPRNQKAPLDVLKLCRRFIDLMNRDVKSTEFKPY